MNNKAHLRPKDFDSSGDIIPSGWKEEKGDLISREALKEKAETVTLWNGDVRRFVSYETIDNAPTVRNEYMRGYEAAEREYKRPQGEWKVKTLSTFPQYQPDEYECPFCKTIVNYKTNFCHKCGADMRKGGAE